MRALLFYCFISISFISNAQNYTPIFNNSNEWQFTLCNTAGCLEDIYYTDGDTTYSGYNYKILNGYHYTSRTFWLREDTLNKKVYLSYYAGSRREALLYDFSLQVGDSIDMKNPISPFISDAGYYKVDSIISKQLHDGNSYNHYYLTPTNSNNSSNYSAEWIEGVGSLSLINAPGGTPDVNNVGKLSCFFKDETLFYSQLDSISDCTPTISNILKTTKKEHLIKISPSIIKDKCHISNIKNFKSLSIYNVNGNLLLEKNIEQSYKIDLSFQQFNPGLYILVFSDHNKRVSSFKVIKE